MTSSASPIPLNTRVLRAEGLRKAFRGKPVVDDVSFEVKPGEVVGLLGPNGAGKTTSFYMVVGILQPDKGSVFLGDENLAYVPMYQRARAGIAYLAQEPSVFRKLTVAENVEAILEATKVAAAERGEYVRTLLQDLGLTHISDRPAYALSGGERRRVEIARCLVLKPAFILLDEPFAGIDPIAVADIQKIVRSLASRGIGVLITDHNVRETLQICDRGYLLDAGKLVVVGSPQEILASKVARAVYLGDEFRF